MKQSGASYKTQGKGAKFKKHSLGSTARTFFIAGNECRTLWGVVLSVPAIFFSVSSIFSSIQIGDLIISTFSVDSRKCIKPSHCSPLSHPLGWLQDVSVSYHLS